MLKITGPETLQRFTDQINEYRLQPGPAGSAKIIPRTDSRTLHTKRRSATARDEVNSGSGKCWAHSSKTYYLDKLSSEDKATHVQGALADHLPRIRRTVSHIVEVICNSTALAAASLH